MATKIGAIAAFVARRTVCRLRRGLRRTARVRRRRSCRARANGAIPLSAHWTLTLAGFGAAMVPVMFAYGGWQTTTFLAGEMKDAQRMLPRALLVGVVGVVTLYVAVNVACLATLGFAGLASTPAPASEILRRAMGPLGGTTHRRGDCRSPPSAG